MRNFIKVLFVAALLLNSGKTFSQTADSTRAMRIQLVFALDATGSMSGLIATAKEKIWSIASSLAQAEPAPEIQMGIVFYRDKTDEFVTRILPLSKDLDSMYSQLMEIRALGGGDTPESVNKALYDAVHKIEWSSDTSMIKTLFLVGDCPPHMDYDEVQYPTTCKEAAKKGIEINTILMGGNSQARKIWKEIADCAQGEFIETDMKMNNFEIVSPYDASIKKLSEEIDATRIYYGSKTKYKNISKTEEAVKFQDITTSESSRRADYNMMNTTSKAAYYGDKELVTDATKEIVKVENLKDEDLPEVLLKMDKEKRVAYVKEITVKRDSLEKQMVILLKQRQDFLQAELAKRDKTEVEKSFDSKIYDKMSRSAKKKGYTPAVRSRF